MCNVALALIIHGNGTCMRNEILWDIGFPLCRTVGRPVFLWDNPALCGTVDKYAYGVSGPFQLRLTSSPLFRDGWKAIQAFKVLWWWLQCKPEIVELSYHVVVNDQRITSQRCGQRSAIRTGRPWCCLNSGVCTLAAHGRMTAVAMCNRRMITRGV